MSTNPKARAWVQVRAEALRDNYVRVRDQVAPGTGLLPMVKANAYGLGVEAVVRVLEPLEPWGFGVAGVSEGARLRELGVEGRIVVCSPAPYEDLAAAVEHRLQLSISSLGALQQLGVTACSGGTTADYHIDIDTGMGRSGFDWRRASDWMSHAVAGAEGARCVGCYTHLHSADENDATVREQWARFSGLAAQVVSLRGSEGPALAVHVLNSAGVFRAPEVARSVVRPGIFLYGGGVGSGQPRPTPVVSVHARVALVRSVPVGTTLGYGSTYTSRRDERWATLSIGYGDGLPRALSNRGSAILHGTTVPIIGRISMDVTVVDITDVEAAREGDIATLVGSEGSCERTLDDVAAEAGTISYEVLTGLTGRLPRVWTDEVV
jgi:alanine racemase